MDLENTVRSSCGRYLKGRKRMVPHPIRLLCKPGPTQDQAELRLCEMESQEEEANTSLGTPTSDDSGIDVSLMAENNQTEEKTRYSLRPPKPIKYV